MVTLRARGKGDAEPSSAPPRRQMPKRSSESPQRAPPMTRRRVAELREEDRLKAKDDERNHVDSAPSADQDQGPAGSAIRKSQNVQKPAGDGGGLRRSTRTMAPIYRYQILSSFNTESTPETKRDDEDETLEQEEDEEEQEEQQEEEEQEEEEEEEQEEEEQQEEGGVEDAAGCSGAKPPSLHRGPSSEFQRRTFRIGASGPFPTRRVAFRHTKDDSSDSDSDDVVRNVGKVPKRRRNLNPDETLADIDQPVGFDSIGGLSVHISALKEMVVFPLLYPEVFDNFKIQPPRGCLFYGPPGTGKTLLARALANECGQFTRKVSFFMRKGADCLRKWVGESEQQLQMLFEQAYQKRPSIIFFDEIDGLAPERSSRQDLVHSSIVSTLLALMDGLDSRGEVVVIGATNRLDSIDPALRRPGRFDREFLFGLPDRETRKEILKIHTRPWKPRPSDEFLDELAGKCVGYCGADIRGVCTEAALCALRRRYPQIYAASQKLLLDCSSIVVGPCDFAAAMRKTLPASHRSAPMAAKPLSPVVQPLLGAALRRALEALQRLFPHAEQGMKRKRAPDRTSGIPDDVLMDGEDAASISTSCPNSSSFLLFTSSAAKHPTSHRPRMLLAGCPASGQTSHLGPALLHALERFTVHNLDSAVLFSVSGTSPEEACAQVFRAARRTPPSVLYMPHIQQWWGTAGCSLRASFLSLLGSVPSLSPILLLATCSVPHEQLDPEIQSLFREEYGEVFAVSVPTRQERGDFFQDLILNQAAEAPPSTRRALTQAVEVLSLAPLSPPRQLPERERLRQEEQEEDVLRKLRLYLRHVTERLTMDRRFKAFGKPVDIEEVPDYLLVVQRPMDFSTLMTNIDKQKYATVAEFLSDADLIWRNALQYNPDSDHMDRHIRHRACALKDTVHNIIRSELYEGFEHECEEIRAARVSRASSCIIETRPEEADCPGPPRGRNKWRRAGADMAAAPQQKQALGEETPPLVVDRATLRNVLSRAVKKTEGCDVAPLEKLHALLAQSVYRHRNNHDKTQLVQEMEKEIDSFSASHTSGLFK